jgi:hypothetical protein
VQEIQKKGDVPLNTTLSEDAWGGNAFQAVSEARFDAITLKDAGKYPESHTLLLSTYIGGLNNIRSGAQPLRGSRRLVTLMDWTLRAEYHAISLRQYDDLDYNQLDVLSTWLVKTAEFFPLRKRSAISYAQRGLRAIVPSDAKPHQRALAWVTFARAASVNSMSNIDPRVVTNAIRSALRYELAIRNESDQPQSLRQFVRVLKNVGDIEMRIGDLVHAQEHLQAALDLAEGEADTKSQAEAIRQLLNNLIDQRLAA